MADVNPNSGLAGLISRYGTDSAKSGLGIEPGQDKAEESKGLDNQSVFMKLYIEQLKNQDPTKPQEAGDMVSQMAEFSSLERLTSMSDALTNMTDALVSNQALTASTLVGRSVYVAKDSISGSEVGQGVTIKTTLPADAVSNTLEISDKDGKVVKTVDLTDENYHWDGSFDDGSHVSQSGEGKYSFQISSRNVDGEVTQLDVRLPARINSVTLNGVQGTTLNVEGVGPMKLNTELEIVG